MSDQIDPAFKAAYRETQGQPVDAEPRRPIVAAQQDGGLVERLLDPEYAGPLQHCRPYTEIDQLFREAATARAEKDARIAELEAAVAVQRESKEYAQRCCVTAESALTASRAECEGLRAKLEKFVAAHALECKQRLAAEADKARSIEALTPSGNTKAAYIGEFHFDYTVWDPHGEDEITHRVSVPWGTIKEIMAAIRARAALSQKETGRE